jgi:hypothetical protein
MSDAIREAFEQWAQDKSLIFDIREEMMYTAGYINVKEMAWEAFCKGWQAALQSAEPVVDVNQQLVEALLMFVQNSSVQVLVPVTCEIAEEALLSAWLLSAGEEPTTAINFGIGTGECRAMPIKELDASDVDYTRLSVEGSLQPLKVPPLFSFHDGSAEVGRIEIIDGQMQFTGNADEAAKVMFKSYCHLFNTQTKPIVPEGYVLVPKTALDGALYLAGLAVAHTDFGSQHRADFKVCCGALLSAGKGGE